MQPPLYPAYQRQRVFECSCCPPNIYRFIAALGQYFYSVLDDTLYVHQYAQSSACLTIRGQEVRMKQTTGYPWDGSIRITIETEQDLEGVIGVRIPGWSREARASVNGVPQSVNAEKGYLYIHRNWKNGDVIELDIPMPVVLLEGHPRLLEAAGKCAVTRGPVVYCVEGADNEGINVFDLMIEQEAEFEKEDMTLEGHSLVILKAKALVNRMDGWQTLYRPCSPEYERVEFTAVPYFAWSNRKANDMTVWLKMRQ